MNSSMAQVLYHSFHPGMRDEREEDLLSPTSQGHGMQAVQQQSLGGHLEQHMMMQRQQEMNVGQFNTTELNAPEYASDGFRMFHFKVERCSKRFVHDWRSCPFAHPTENARRRDPRQFKYVPVPCPDYKRGICLRGDTCPYSHGVYECWLHPAKYKTQLCKEGPRCKRPVCFFAHSVGDLRQPTHVFQDDAQNEAEIPKTVAAALMQHVQADAQSIQSSEQEEALNNMGKSNEKRSEGSSSDSGNNNEDVGDSSQNVMLQNEDSTKSSQDVLPAVERMQGFPATPQAQRKERSAAMPTTDNVSLLGIGSPREEDKVRPVSLDTQIGYRANGLERKSMDGAWTNSNTTSQLMQGVPVNEQPLVSTQGPRMSNAVARKLGLAPTRTSSASSAGIMSPQRRSFDLAQQQQQHMNARRSLDGYNDYGNVDRFPLSSSHPDAMHPSLLAAMNGIEYAHAAHWLESSNPAGAGNLNSIVNSMGSLNFRDNAGSFQGNGSQMSQGLTLPLNLDEYESAGERHA
ncbi:hypothetical protein M9435_004810 [Picochlorum sp. BPE23]|nr:hypothetical protein M9435_004810 [Picochlorum sp. BPE23]